MSQNRFEQVDARQDDAITLILSRKNGAPMGFVTCPAPISGGRCTEDQISAEGAAQDAVRSAGTLANELQAGRLG